jgi:hypothetical protein
MKHQSVAFFLILLGSLLLSCNNPATILQSDTWIMYEHIQTEISSGEVAKSKFEKAEKALVLNFEPSEVGWVENGVDKRFGWELKEDQTLNVDGKNYEIVKLGERWLILASESNGYRHELLFAPDKCPCWDKQ